MPETDKELLQRVRIVGQHKTIVKLVSVLEFVLEDLNTKLDCETRLIIEDALELKSDLNVLESETEARVFHYPSA